MAGGFLYLIHFSKLLAPLSDIPSQSAAEEFVIVSEAYGGCRSMCPSFRLDADGSYRLELYDEESGERTFKEGVIPRDVLRNVQSAFADDDSLAEQSERINPRECNSYSDGIDVRYTVTLEGEEFTLDSCGTRVDGEGEIWKSLAKIWEYFRTVK